MKKFKFPILVLLAVGMVASFNSCRKGEEDPRLTFRSRDTRVTGVWSMREYSVDTTTTVNRDKKKNIAEERSVVKEENNIETITAATIAYDSESGSLTSKVDVKKTEFFNDGSASATTYDQSYVATAVYDIKELKITLNEDYTFGIDYSYELKSNKSCPQEVLGGGWSAEGSLGCDTLALSGDYIRSVSIVNAGFWKWNDEEETDQIEIGFESTNLKTGEQQYTLSGYNLKTDIAGSPIGTLMSGYITRLTNKEMHFKSTADRQVDWLRTEYLTDAQTGDGNEVRTDDYTSTTTGTRTEIWEKLEDEE